MPLIALIWYFWRVKAVNGTAIIRTNARDR